MNLNETIKKTLLKTVNVTNENNVVDNEWLDIAFEAVNERISQMYNDGITKSSEVVNYQQEYNKFAFELLHHDGQPEGWVESIFVTIDPEKNVVDVFTVFEDDIDAAFNKLK